MTTDTCTAFDFAPTREVTVPNERVAATVTAIAYVLLLPAATVLMSILTA